MSKDNPFKKAIDSRHQSEQPIAPTVSEKIEPKIEVAKLEPSKISSMTIPSNTTIETATNKKRGRPATGKRSDDSWIGRTYYIQRETDLDVEDQLLQLKRQGVDIDKSELVDFLLGTWVKLQKGEKATFRISEISPR